MNRYKSSIEMNLSIKLIENNNIANIKEYKMITIKH